MKRALMKKVKKEHGQSLVELSLGLILLLLLVSGVAEFGMAFFQFIQLRDASQEGAVYASTNPADKPGIIARVQGSSNTPINLTTLTPTITYYDTTGTITTDNTKKCEGGGVKVELAYDHQIFMPFIPAVLGKSTIALKASVTDTILTPVCPAPP